MLKFSIITPSYNQKIYIEKTIKSVLNQNYPNFEHIIIDGGSTDGTTDILKKYKHLTWISKKDRGQTHAINKGLKKSNGDIICWLNSDDYYEKNVFLKINKYFEKNKNVTALYGNCNIIDENNKLIYTYKSPKFNLEKLITRCNNYIPQPSLFFRKKIIKKIGLLNEKLNYAMDHELFIKIAQNGIIKKKNNTFANFRKHKTSKTTKDILKMKKESFLICKNYTSTKKTKIKLFLNYYISVLVYSNPLLIKIIRYIWIKLNNVSLK